jgi:hypothetical protein
VRQSGRTGALQKAALCAAQLECHAGHGLSYGDVGPVAAIPEVRELNIGHFLVGEAIFVGLEPAIREMRRIMERRGRQGRRVIIGIGNDLVDIRRIEKSLERFGDRFVRASSPRSSSRAPRGRPSGELRQALCCQGGVLQGAGHRAAPRRLLARHGRRQPAWRPADAGADRRGTGPSAGIDAGRNVAANRLTLTDEYPMAQAFVIISAVSSHDRRCRNLQCPMPDRGETAGSGPAIGAARLNWYGDDGRG